MSFTTEDDSGVGSEKADSDVFVSDYRRLLLDQIHNVVQAERDKRMLDKCEELNIAIDLCKTLLVEVRENNKRQLVMDMLVELKLELDQLRENMKDGKPLVRRWEGHEFVQQSSHGRNPYCEVCVTTIWRLAQSWRRCSKCGFRTHDKCIPNIVGTCAAVIVSAPNFEFSMDICPETSLASQNFECYECHTAIGFDEKSEQEPRLCDYTGHYYCRNCHWNDQMVIPARIVKNWDFEPRLICRSSKKLLIAAYKKPLINLEKENSLLLQFVDNVNEICKIRRQIMIMKCFFVCCRMARRLRILQYLNNYQHFVETSEYFSIDDLMKLGNENLLAEVKTVLDIFHKHITEECEICRGYAHVCELCSNKEFLFPFSDDTSTCVQCCAVFHQQCFQIVSRRCPKCARREARRCAIVKEQDEGEQKSNNIES